MFGRKLAMDREDQFLLAWMRARGKPDRPLVEQYPEPLQSGVINRQGWRRQFQVARCSHGAAGEFPQPTGVGLAARLDAGETAEHLSTEPGHAPPVAQAAVRQSA